ncbi:hypothetical protein [Ralstonia mannitolilytica]|uniref:Uncharacterized protein n=1 Tax=Ralstonia mannitolilytica TaxID=105219 RepID=A0AAJ4ZPI7_9RALS|nr:hypothetical protein [Ralstonia mannitolilytica]AJW47325.1 hypothetical protein TK49_22090 [Ralstonia mannitolilytica]MBU9580562.1 hypothetical protein [Ralstonia mannitolilytica]QIF09676.1 hypothetical protein G5A69_19260 [Ralstonia mannitolilytica]CAG2151007.1 hypothetical protein LMG6866_03979 [Ralstonia mannitolilytica]CAJ0729698.1 hypothetical protein R76706_02122 [Ralstonia mannitolilytica]
MVSESTFVRLVRASGWYDLIVTAPFATPWSFMLLHHALNAVAGVLGIAGLPPFEPAHMLMANLMGSVVCVWSVLRIRHPSVALGRYDAVARTLFAAWQGYALGSGATLLVVPFMVAEAGFGLLQAMPVRRVPVHTGAQTA